MVLDAVFEVIFKVGSGTFVVVVGTHGFTQRAPLLVRC